jgi:hypothetical protein
MSIKAFIKHSVVFALLGGIAFHHIRKKMNLIAQRNEGAHFHFGAPERELVNRALKKREGYKYIIISTSAILH